MENQPLLDRYKWVIMAITALGIIVAIAYVMMDQNEPVTISINPPLPTATHTPSPLPSPTDTAAPLEIYVTGAVVNPDRYTLPQGSRVEDALEAAGGALDSADLTVVNLAQALRDGDQINVPNLPPTPNPTADEAESATLEPNPTPTSNAPRLININTATQEELETLPNIGEATARAIIEYREANGDFETIEEITEVSGIGERTLENLRPLITVSD